MGLSKTPATFDVKGVLPEGACATFSAGGPVAQRLEQGTHNPLVRGSNPCGPTNPSRFVLNELMRVSQSEMPFASGPL